MLKFPSLFTAKTRPCPPGRDSNRFTVACQNQKTGCSALTNVHTSKCKPKCTVLFYSACFQWLLHLKWLTCIKWLWSNFSTACTTIWHMYLHTYTQIIYHTSLNLYTTDSVSFTLLAQQLVSDTVLQSRLWHSCSAP